MFEIFCEGERRKKKKKKLGNVPKNLFEDSYDFHLESKEMNDDDDIYSSLPSYSKNGNAMSSLPDAPLSSQSSAHSDLKIENRELKKQVDQLLIEQNTLTNNIVILYETARSELNRKDRQIKDLRSELTALQRNR